MPRGRITGLWAVRGARGPLGLGTGLLLALGAMTLVPLVQIGAGLVTGLVDWQPATGLLGLFALVPVVLLVQAITGAGEELGWRGYLHTLLRPWGFWRTAVLVGVVWSLWHLPVAMLSLTGAMSGREFTALLIGIMAWAPLFAALREVTGSVWPAVLAHGLFNSLRVLLAQNLVTPAAQLPGPTFWAWEAIGWVLCLAAAVAVLALARRRGPSGMSPAAGARLRGVRPPGETPVTSGRDGRGRRASADRASTL